MSEAFRLGGWGMWPTLVFGVLMLAAAVYYAVRAEPRLAALVRRAGWMTLIAGCLGFVTGLIRSCIYISDVPADDRFLVIIGFGESLHNVALALVLIMLALMISSVGVWRQAHRPAAPGAA
jgi:uncharacterized protein YacL